ncbi:WD repeat-containing protein 26 homolog [Impatiens glandulifera]|uniref:WD repeat-containing protein 26 homolog n=1 Tax=Impatiens glandulifera TaxID=253017 RepID=UPI001FB0656B|nr:WD repeat-containing protein 26 homolog [Impatiens glandulifera]XP_047320016.1 WD repeat-containing protein 26 homolog [Impatiens glandulifera]
MGGIEDTEPPLKRVKLPPGDLQESFGTSSNTSSVFGSFGASMARPLSSQEDSKTVGSKGVIKREEFVKIITRALYSLGYNKAGALLQEESGIQVHSSAVSIFMQQVVDGKWDESLATLRKINFCDETNVKSASFLVLEQKFLELLREKKIMDAIGTLRNEITPLSVNVGRVHELATWVISPSRSASSGQCNNDYSDQSSRSTFLEELKKLLPAAVMVPESRLIDLVEQAIDMQRVKCTYHNCNDSEASLLTDHHCGENQIPSQTSQVLHGHDDEVWFLQFSHGGKFLASSSKDRSAIIWEVKENGHVALKHRLTGHQKPILMVSWSHDDHQLLTCGMEEIVRRWDVDSGECLHIYEKTGVGFVSCGWLPYGEGITTGMTDKSICLWDLEGREVECWKGQRTLNTSDMAVTDDGNRILSMCKETAILLLDKEEKVDRLIEETQVITSFSLSIDNKFILVNLGNQEIHLWSIHGKPKIVHKYEGHKRTRFLIRSCLGGVDEAFVASGSEDSQVYIWLRGNEELISILPGHAGSVNCVSWNPRNSHMLASGSDDRTIRIWGIPSSSSSSSSMKSSCSQSNGDVYHSNGKI